jgi:hypothetical protein
MIQFLLQHQFWAAGGIYWVFSAAVSGMPEPDPKGGPGYIWVYRFLHSIAGNITTVFGGKLPSLKPFIPPALVLPVLLAAPACAGLQYSVHPGALNTADSAAYDTLQIAATTIIQAQADFQAGKPALSKDALNQLVASYNVARVSWLTYRNAIATNAPADAYVQQLNQNLISLTNAIRTLTSKEVKP